MWLQESSSPNQHDNIELELKSSSYCDRKTRSTRKCPCRSSSKLCEDYCHPDRLCTNVINNECIVEQGDIEIVSVDESDTNVSEDDVLEEEKSVLIGSAQLMESDKNVIRDGDWLTDTHFTAAQHLKEKYPNISGLQDTTLQYTRTYEIQGNREFVQCLHVRNDHWITISTINCLPGVVNVYDSMHRRVPLATKNIIADLLQSQKKSIILKYANIQIQEGGNDCGLFAIAIATAICNGDKPELLEFDQKMMRRHFLKCLQDQVILPFPSQEVVRDSDFYDMEDVEIFCVCRQMDNGRKNDFM